MPGTSSPDWPKPLDTASVPADCQADRATRVASDLTRGAVPRVARRAENGTGGGVSEARSHGQHAFAARGVSGAGARERPVTLIVTEQNGLVEREESMIHSAHPGTCRLLSAPRVQHQLILVSRGPARSRSMSRNQRTPHVCLRSIPSDEPMADCLPVAQGDRASKRNNRR